MEEWSLSVRELQVLPAPEKSRTITRIFWFLRYNYEAIALTSIGKVEDSGGKGILLLELLTTIKNMLCSGCREKYTEYFIKCVE